MLSGASDAAGSFLTQPRPKLLRLSFDDGTSKEVKLADSPSFQQFRLTPRPTTTLTIEVVEVFSSPEGSACSISELEFFATK